MILYTIVDSNEVFKDNNYNQTENESQSNEKYKEIKVDGVMVQVSKADDSDLRIERIISTNPFDYLRNNIQPGKIIKKSKMH